MTAIKATFSDFRIVKGRKVAQLIFECPIEAADAALAALGGVPRSDAEQWVGIAPITGEAAARPTEKPKRRMNELSRVQQAGIMCNEVRFAEFLEKTHGEPIRSFEDREEGAAAFVRKYCMVNSRSLLNEGSGAMRWDMLKNEYDFYCGRTAGPDDR